MINSFIFDFGGVITPIEPWDGWNPTDEERLIIRKIIPEIAKLFASELKEFKFTVSDFEREFKARAIGIKNESAERIIRSLCTPNKELLSLISKLSLKYKIYGLVNAPFGWTELRRGIHGLDRYFNQVFVSYEIGVRKPDPKIFNYLLENTGLVPNECLFVDDKEENVLAAKQLGMEGHVFKSTDDFKEYLSQKQF